MSLINLYSGAAVYLLAVAVGLAIVLRRGGRRGEWITLGILAALGVLLWLGLRPTQTVQADSLLTDVLRSGQSVLLEFQSPY